MMDFPCGNLWIKTLKKLPKDAPKIANKITMIAVKRYSPPSPSSKGIRCVPRAGRKRHALTILNLKIEAFAGMIVQRKAGHKLAAIIVIDLKTSGG